MEVWALPVTRDLGVGERTEPADLREQRLLDSFPVNGEPELPSAVLGVESGLLKFLWTGQQKALYVLPAIPSINKPSRLQ